MTEEMNNAATEGTAVEAPAEGVAPSIPDPTTTPAPQGGTTDDIPAPEGLTGSIPQRSAQPVPSNGGINHHDISRAVEQGFSAILSRFDEEESNDGEADPEKPLTKKELEEYKASIMQEMMQTLHYEKERARLHQEAEREEIRYLKGVEASIATVVPAEEDSFGHLKELSKSRMSELIAMAQVQVGRTTLTPAEVKLVEEVHWQLFKPVLVAEQTKRRSRSSAAMSSQGAQTNVSLAGTTASRGSFPTNQNASGVNKAIEEYNKKKESGNLSLEEALAFNLGFTVNS